jgi:hypothetical protein
MVLQTAEDIRCKSTGCRYPGCASKQICGERFILVGEEIVGRGCLIHPDWIIPTSL